ncbi:hypothetical protein DPMN_074905 [Dreissena polymorpha]|uniref:Uncharacterized protein n=1 Tax=Dreissena polymorpha TaxID=45954 RepID=A0A9D3YG43_DREPO|nr:hypothetical protein DPMN_074905 [Dreissena polymorpha]
MVTDDSLADSKEETDSKESKESQEKDVKEEADDYMAYLHGDDLTKYDNEHEKFKAAQKVMQQHQHEKVTKMLLSHCIRLIQHDNHDNHDNPIHVPSINRSIRSFLSRECQNGRNHGIKDPYQEKLNSYI